VASSACRTTSIPAGRSVALASRIHAGDRAAESEFARTFSRELLLLLLKKTNDPDIAKDCCQQTLLIALTKMREGGISKPGSLALFVKRTAENVAITHFRKEKRYCLLEDGVILMNTVTVDTAAREIDFESIRTVLHEIVDQLSVPRDREILRRFYLREENKRDICRDFGIKSEHFDRVLYRARKRLRRLVDKQKEVKTLFTAALA